MPPKIIGAKDKKKQIIERLRDGSPIAAAARKIGISRAEAYRWKDEDQLFAQLWDEAVIEGAEMLEEEARRRAVDGYNEKPILNREGEEIALVKEYSDGLLSMLLKAKNPRVFNPAPQVAQLQVDHKISVAEAFQQLQRLGLPAPIIEGDFDDDDAG